MLLATLGVLLQLAVPETLDASHVLREARAAQARFERVRRMHLPRKPAAGGSRTCHARVGRYCYWYDPADSTVEAEPVRIRDARRQLLTSLDSAAARVPADGWIAGQRVRYLIEAGQPEEAAAVARGCVAERWWCDALAGLALHVAGWYGAADSAFRHALDGMPESQRCAWVDLSVLADPRQSRRLRGEDCRDREARAERLWSLSQPLWMLEGNDLRTEHFARHTMAAILQRAANAHAMSFGADSRELLLRYGWAEWYTREETGVGGYAAYAVTGHDREPSFHFFPHDGEPEVLRFPAASHWQLTDTLAPSRYAPRRIERLAELPHQLARFPRGDSTLVAVALSPPDTARTRPVRAAIATHDGRAPAVVARDSGTTLAALIPRDTMVVGIEVYADSSKHAARARYALAPLPCTGWCVSDILLLRRASPEPASAESALRSALPRLAARAGETVGAYFEVQRPTATEAKVRTDFTLTVTPIRVSALRRLAATLRVADPPNAVRLRWSGLLDYAGTVAAQYVSLRVPPGARGTYRVELRITPPGGETLVTSRDLVVTR